MLKSIPHRMNSSKRCAVRTRDYETRRKRIRRGTARKCHEELFEMRTGKPATCVKRESPEQRAARLKEGTWCLCQASEKWNRQRKVSSERGRQDTTPTSTVLFDSFSTWQRGFTGTTESSWQRDSSGETQKVDETSEKRKGEGMTQRINAVFQEKLRSWRNVRKKKGRRHDTADKYGLFVIIRIVI